jgi:hypothetical protein
LGRYQGAIIAAWLGIGACEARTVVARWASLRTKHQLSYRKDAFQEFTFNGLSRQ